MSNVRIGLRWVARGVVYPIVESLWRSAFAGAGRLLRPHADECPPTGGDRVLAIAPHPDDETLGCGGTLALHSRAGDQVCVLMVTDGGNSRAGGRSRQEMGILRSAEAEAATRILGRVALLQLSLPEGRWANGQLQSALTELLDSFRPTLIYAPSCVDFHPEHLRVAQEVARALRAMPGGFAGRVRVYELQVPLTPLLVNVRVDISAATRVKNVALAQYRTQLSSFAWVRRHASYLQRLYRTTGPVEVFWELQPDEYCRLMEAYSRLKPSFYSIHHRPFTDGLAWLVGLRVRACLKRLACGRM